MDSLAALRLQIEWGADEALDEAPVDRMTVRAQKSAVAAAAVETPAVAAPVATPATGRQALVQRAQAAAAAAMTRDALRAALLAFDGCALAATATNLVFDDGNPEAGLMLIGEGPGAEEDREGRPFVGPTGALLDRMLASIGLDRGGCLITNVLPWRPPGNRTPTEAEVQICLPFLLRHVALARPRRIVLLGALATHALLGTKGGMSRLRGRWAEASVEGLASPVACLPMLHPAYLMQNPASKGLAWNDLMTLRRALDSDVE